MKDIRVYVAGPYTKPDPCINVNAAVEVSDDLLSLGFIPFVPHLTHLWHLISPHTYDEWLAYDMKWLEVCDVLLRFDGESSGADKEVERAIEIGIPVVYSFRELVTLVKAGGL